MEKIAHIIWPHSFLSNSEVCNDDAYNKIVELCNKGIYCSIYSGRSMETLSYIKDKIASIAEKQNINPNPICKKIKIYGEGGLIRMDLDTMFKRVTAPEFNGHKITGKYFDDFLNLCFLNPEEIKNVEKDQKQEDIPYDMNLVLDSINNMYLLPINTRSIIPLKHFPDFVLNLKKQYSKTAEGFRSLDKVIIPEIKEKIQKTSELIKDLLCEWGLSKDIHVQATDTSIDFYAILSAKNNIVCDISYGLGKGIEILSKQLDIPIKEVLDRTVFIKPKRYKNDLIPVINYEKNPENKINTIEVTKENKYTFCDKLSIKPF